MNFFERLVQRIIYEHVLDQYQGIPGEPHWTESQEPYLRIQQIGEPYSNHAYQPMHSGFTPFPLRYDLVPYRYIADSPDDDGIEVEKGELFRDAA